MNFDLDGSPENNPDEPITYTLLSRKYIEKTISKQPTETLKIFDSVHKKLKNRIYAFNIGDDPKVNQYPNLRDSVIRAGSNHSEPELTITLSDFDGGLYGDNETFFGAFDKDTGRYIKYSDLETPANEAIIKPGNTGLKNFRIKATFSEEDDFGDGTKFGTLTLEKTPELNSIGSEFIVQYNSNEDKIIAAEFYDEGSDIFKIFLEKRKIPYKIISPTQHGGSEFNWFSIDNISKYFDITTKE
jgi:hypothetical protein